MISLIFVAVLASASAGLAVGDGEYGWCGYLVLASLIAGGFQCFFEKRLAKHLSYDGEREYLFEGFVSFTILLLACVAVGVALRWQVGVMENLPTILSVSIVGFMVAALLIRGAYDYLSQHSPQKHQFNIMSRQ